jgi:hypothetical protein
MKKIYLAVFAILLTGLLLLAACAPSQQPQGQPYPYGPGMMGPGMMGSWGLYNPDAEQISIDDAAKAVEQYLQAYYGKNLVLKEVMDFAWNYYAEVEEEDTGIHALELLIDKYSGQVYPEMGPNMMWNTKYGMMGSYFGSTAPDMTVSPEQARETAQKFLDKNLPEYTVGEADTFYGYYTLHTLKDGQIEGMLSVNGYDGSIWYHNWHGEFIGMKEYGEH